MNHYQSDTVARAVRPGLLLGISTVIIAVAAEQVAVDHDLWHPARAFTVAALWLTAVVILAFGRRVPLRFAALLLAAAVALTVFAGQPSPV